MSEYIPLLLIAICLSVMGELALKHGMNQAGTLHFQPDVIVEGLVRTFSQPFVLLGFGLVFGGSIFWLAVLSRVDLSLAYPMLSLSYVLGVVMSRILFNEPITITRLLGVVVICAGVFVISRS